MADAAPAARTATPLPAIPQPGADMASVLATVNALKQAVEQLSGTRGTGRAITTNDMMRLGLASQAALASPSGRAASVGAAERTALQIAGITRAAAIQAAFAASFAGVAGATVNGHRALMPDTTGRLVHAQPAEATYAFAGISTGSATVGAEVRAVVAGPITEPSWSWTPLAPLYVGASGTLTATPPTTGAAQQVAVAISATSILVQPGPILIRH